jgi:integrase
MSSTKLFLYKRSNGFWYIGHLEDGRRRWRSTGSRLKTEALKALTEFAETIKPKISTVLFSQFVQQFFELQGTNLRTSTLARIYRPAFKSFQACCGDKPLPSYTLKDIESFKSKRLATCRPTTVNIEFRTVRAAFNCAIKWQLLNQNPFAQSAVVKIPERPPIHFSREEFSKFLGNVAEPFLKDLFLFAALTGLRQGEILALKWGEVDLERRLIFIVNSDFFFTKSGKSRIVPMSDAVLDMLTRKSMTQQFSEFVFHRDGSVVTQSYVDHKFKKYVRQSGLREELKFHSLRHTFATWLAKSGVSIYEIQKLLGHSDVKTTQIYSHLAASELHNAVNKILVPLN